VLDKALFNTQEVMVVSIVAIQLMEDIIGRIFKEEVKKQAYTTFMDYKQADMICLEFDFDYLVVLVV
jgi:hypothetical protein